MLGADFLKGKDVWLDSVDDLGEASNLVVVLLLRRRSVRMADRGFGYSTSSPLDPARWYLLVVGQNDRQVVPMKVRVSRDYEQHAWWSVATHLVPNLWGYPLLAK